MFRGLRGIIYKVPDIKKARDWYSKVFEARPIFDTSFLVLFPVGDSTFSLIPATDVTVDNNDNIAAYWEVDDIDFEYRRLLQLGATVHTEITYVFNRKRAAVVDPFGNILGIRTAITDTGKPTVEQQPSKTAMGAAMARAAAVVDEREEIRGHDYLAQIFLPEDLKVSLKTPAVIRGHINGRMPGMYEYIIARTVYFDHIFEQALCRDFTQIVFLGAGYDTRPYRFKDLIKDTMIFELDIHTTQENKIRLLHQNKIPIPKQLTFVPINFDKKALGEVLIKAGYNKDQKSLFIWEGVTYYLLPGAIDDTLDFIKSSSSVGSVVCFDYSSVWPEMQDAAYGLKKIMETMRTDYSGEAARFSIERGKTASFLGARGFKIIDHLNAEEMENRFLTLQDGSLAGNVTGHFCFVSASVSG